jgi:diguanylate cyclase (GGDEF)-like protein/PAS domain S-box-containing protein
MTALAQVGARLRDSLPRGRTLSDSVFESRHRALALILALQYPALAAVGIAEGKGVLHCLLESSSVAVAALIALKVAKTRKSKSLTVSIGLLTASALLVHFTNGLVESHFHFFVMISLLTLYEDWTPYLVAIGYVALHHGIGGAIAPGTVFNHPDAAANSWKYAGIHAFFVAAAGAANVVAWRLNENVREELEASENALASAEQVAHLGNWRFDVTTGLVTWSDELFRIHGYEPGQIQPDYDVFLNHVDPDDRDMVNERVSEAQATGRPFEFDYRLITLGGDLRVVQARGEPQTNEEGEVFEMFGTALDVTDRKLTETELRRSREELAHQALHDSLTDLPNRMLFEERLQQALARAARTGTLQAVLFIDLDNFKLVNDLLGHSAGDELLREVASRLTPLLRPLDTVARFGGDEFVILAEDLDDERHALAIAARVNGAFARPVDAGGRTHFVSASVGVAVARPGDSTESLLRDADSAMYRAKEAGRGRHEIFDEDMRQRMHDRVDLERDLRAALRDRRLRLHYQPVVNIDTGKPVAFEALARWKHTERGDVPPGDFIPLAEETGIIGELGAWTLRETCAQIARWRAQGLVLPISVNLSGRQLSNVLLIDDVASALREHHVDPWLLALEITESTVIEQAETALDTLLALKRLGVKILLDDFGTGYSSLAYLARFPIDTLKLDRSFIASLSSPRRRAIVRAILDMASALEIDVIAEGVETEVQRAELRGLGCTLAQGFLFGQAMPSAPLSAMLRRDGDDRPAVPDEPVASAGDGEAVPA